MNLNLVLRTDQSRRLSAIDAPLHNGFGLYRHLQIEYGTFLNRPQPGTKAPNLGHRTKRDAAFDHAKHENADFLTLCANAASEVGGGEVPKMSSFWAVRKSAYTQRRICYLQMMMRKGNWAR